MEIAISIPDDVFADAEKLARALKKSRSQLYSHALKEYVARHAADQVTEALDRVCGDNPPAFSFSSPFAVAELSGYAGLTRPTAVEWHQGNVLGNLE